MNDFMSASRESRDNQRNITDTCNNFHSIIIRMISRPSNVTCRVCVWIQCIRSPQNDTFCTLVGVSEWQNNGRVNAFKWHIKQRQDTLDYDVYKLSYLNQRALSATLSVIASFSRSLLWIEMCFLYELWQCWRRHNCISPVAVLNLFKGPLT